MDGKNLKGGISLGWMQMLEKTYDVCHSIVGKQVNEDPVLLPISHSTANAQIEVTIDMDGNFVPTLSGTIPKEGTDKITIIPVTEDSASRSNGSAPHALSDKLCYVAGDYKNYTGEDKTDYYRDYLDNLKKWVTSEYSNKWLECIYNYLQKASLIQDLLNTKILVLSENGLLSESENKLQTISQKDALVRFAVWDGMEKHELWKEDSMYQSFIAYYRSTLKYESTDYVTGETVLCSEKHPSKLRNSADKAKLISGNDESGFTYRGRFEKRGQVVSVGYESSQKAHNALRWLLARQGKYVDGEVTVAWKLSHDIQTVNQEMIESIDLLENTVDIFWNEADWLEDCRDDDDIELGRTYAEQLNKSMVGYRKKFKPDDKVMILSVDAATTGRLSITYYKELPGTEFADRILYWHHNCTWPRLVKLKDTKRYVVVEAAPSPEDMVLAAFGTEQGNGYLNCDGKLKKATVRRILPCIVGASAKIPVDIVKAAVNRASNPQAYSSFVWRNNVLSVACAMIKYNEFNGRVETMDLGKDRSYLFGKLLAVLEKMEEEATYFKDSKADDRLTNAKKLWNVYTRRPAVTYERLYSHITRAYLRTLYAGTRRNRENEMMHIVNTLQSIDGFNNNRLDEKYLIGYYEEREKLMKSKNEKKANDNEGGEE